THRQGLQRPLPQSTAAAIAATAVCRDQQFLGSGIAWSTHFFPPPADRLHRELRRVVIDTHAHPALILAQIIDAVGSDLAQLGCALRSPLASAVLELANQLLFLRIHRDHRLTAMLKLLHGGIDMLELRIAIRMGSALLRLAVTLQAVVRLVQHSTDASRTQRVALARQDFG